MQLNATEVVDRQYAVFAGYDGENVSFLPPLQPVSIGSARSEAHSSLLFRFLPLKLRVSTYFNQCNHLISKDFFCVRRNLCSYGNIVCGPTAEDVKYAFILSFMVVMLIQRERRANYLLDDDCQPGGVCTSTCAITTRNGCGWKLRWCLSSRRCRCNI